MEKAFALPLVNATYDSLASLSTPLQVMGSLTCFVMMYNCRVVLHLFVVTHLLSVAAVCREGCCYDVLHGRVL